MKIDPTRIVQELKDACTPRNAFFLALCIGALALAYAPLSAFFASPMGGYYTHIGLIPLVSLYLLYLKQNEIAAVQTYCPGVGLTVMVAGLALYFGNRILGTNLDANNSAAVSALAIFIFVQGAFVLIYGLKAYRSALFPLLFLICIVPLPTAVMDSFITFLQKGSTEITNLLFMASGVPFVRDGFVFHLPNLSVEVARQCSGIRSSMAIFITAVLAGYFFLKSPLKILFLVVCAVVITLFKNGIRIITLTLLGNYVDPRILQSDLHREGGIPFFAIALLLLAPILFFLIRLEKKKKMGNG